MYTSAKSPAIAEESVYYIIVQRVVAQTVVLHQLNGLRAEQGVAILGGAAAAKKAAIEAEYYANVKEQSALLREIKDILNKK